MPTPITSFEIIGLSKTVDNPIYSGVGAGCCGVMNLKLKILPGANFPLTITQMAWIDACSSYQIMTVNGLPWASPLSSPIIVNPGDEIPFQIAICACNGGGSVFTGQLDIIYDDPINGPGVIDSWVYNFIEQEMRTLPPFTDTYVNHYPCENDPSCPPRPGFLYFTNPTVADVWVGIISLGGEKCRVDGVDVFTFPTSGIGVSFLAKAGQMYEL